MKRIKVKLLAIVLIIFPMILSAQDSSIEDLYDEYVGEVKDFKGVNLTKDIFMLMAQMGGNFESEEFEELQDAVSGLNGMKVISYDLPKSAVGLEFKSKIDKILDKGNFVELMTVKEVGSESRFMLRKDGEDIIELLLLVDEENQINLLSFFGIIDLKAISKLSRSVKLKGMESFEKLSEDYQ